MADLTTYAGLKESIADWLNRADLTAQIPAFVSLAHSKLNMELRVRDMQQHTTFDVPGQFFTLPDDFAELYALANPTSQPPLDYIEPARMLEVSQQPSTGPTRFYSIIGKRLQFYPAPAAPTTLPAVYYQYVPALSDTATSNWLLARAPGAYLYGALLEAMPYLKNDVRVPVWETARQQAIDLLVRESDRALRPATKLVARAPWR